MLDRADNEQTQGFRGNGAPQPCGNMAADKGVFPKCGSAFSESSVPSQMFQIGTFAVVDRGRESTQIRL